MKCIEISQIKEFTTQLFTGTAFDEFLMSEVQISTAATFTIDGHVNESFVGEEDMQNEEYREGFLLWRKVRPVCFEIIKGRKVPSRFQIVLKLSDRQLDRFLEKAGMQARKNQIGGLFLNIRFLNKQLSCTTGTALKPFSLDKSLEAQWDDYAMTLLRKYE